jgi:hypothetical protein
MLSRGGLGIISVIGLLIALGLILTHGQSAGTVGTTFFKGVDQLINDLELNPKSGTLHG